MPIRPQPTNAESLAAEARSSQRSAVVPRSRPDRLVRRDQAARQGQQEHDRVIGHLLGAVVGNVADDHAVAGRGVEVDIVVPDPGPDHAPAARCPLRSWIRPGSRDREST